MFSYSNALEGDSLFYLTKTEELHILITKGT